MRRAFSTAVLLVVLLFQARSASATNVMMFDALPADFAEIPGYAEAGIMFSGIDPARHFHADVNLNNGTTAAYLYTTDNSPQRIRMNVTFSLVSIDFVFVGTEVVVTSSTGVSASIQSPGIYTFGPGFRNITYADVMVIDINGDDLAIIDDITTRPVPEPGSFSMLAGALAVLLAGRRALISG